MDENKDISSSGQMEELSKCLAFGLPFNLSFNLCFVRIEEQFLSKKKRFRPENQHKAKNKFELQKQIQ